MCPKIGQKGLEALRAIKSWKHLRKIVWFYLFTWWDEIVWRRPNSLRRWACWTSIRDTPGDCVWSWSGSRQSLLWHCIVLLFGLLGIKLKLVNLFQFYIFVNFVCSLTLQCLVWYMQYTTFTLQHQFYSFSVSNLDQIGIPMLNVMKFWLRYLRLNTIDTTSKFIFN